MKMVVVLCKANVRLESRGVYTTRRLTLSSGEREVTNHEPNHEVVEAMVTCAEF